MAHRSNCSSEAAQEPTSRIEQIADAALRRFARHGFKRTSMDDIAKEAGLAKATLYLHVKGKDDVFRAMVTRLGQRVALRCRDVADMTMPFSLRLAALLDAHYGTVFASYGAGEHLDELKAVTLTVARSELLIFEENFARFARDLLEKAEAQGEITLARVGLPAETLVAALMQAAIGAKFGITPSCEIYGSRLRDLAAVFAAALAKNDVI